MDMIRAFFVLMLSLLLTACATSADRQPFDEIFLVERPKPDISLLYVVLTDAGGYENTVRLVVRHASVAMREAARHEGHQFNVVFFVRSRADTRRGASTGFGVEQLREIADASPQRAEELVHQHTNYPG